MTLIDRLGSPGYLDRMSKSRKDWYGFLHFYRQFHREYKARAVSETSRQLSTEIDESPGVPSDEGGDSPDADRTGEDAWGAS